MLSDVNKVYFLIFVFHLRIIIFTFKFWTKDSLVHVWGGEYVRSMLNWGNNTEMGSLNSNEIGIEM